MSSGRKTNTFLRRQDVDQLKPNSQAVPIPGTINEYARVLSRWVEIDLQQSAFGIGRRQRNPGFRTIFPVDFPQQTHPLIH